MDLPNSAIFAQFCHFLDKIPRFLVFLVQTNTPYAYILTTTLELLFSHCAERFSFC